MRGIFLLSPSCHLEVLYARRFLFAANFRELARMIYKFVDSYSLLPKPCLVAWFLLNLFQKPCNIRLSLRNRQLLPERYRVVLDKSKPIVRWGRKVMDPAA